jgi:hypothetical protein
MKVYRGRRRRRRRPQDVITIELCVLYSVGLLCGHNNVGSHPLIIWVGMVDTKPIGRLLLPLVITCSMDQRKTFDKLLVVASIKFSCKQSTNLLNKSEKEEEEKKRRKP